MSPDAKKNTRTLRLPVNAGTNTDTFSENVPLMRTVNYVMSPDGSGIRPREGFEIRRNDAIGYDSGRKLISLITNPPDINYGDMLFITNTENRRNFVEMTEVVRTTNTRELENPVPMPLPPDVGTLSFDEPVSFENYTAPVSVPVLATGDGGQTAWEAYVIEYYGSGGAVIVPLDSGTVSATESVPGSIDLTMPSYEGVQKEVVINLVPPTTEGITLVIDEHTISLSEA